MASTDQERKDKQEEEEAAGGEDEDTGAQIGPIVRLEEVAVTTGEEDEHVLLDLYALSLSSTRKSGHCLIYKGKEPDTNFWVSLRYVHFNNTMLGFWETEE